MSSTPWTSPERSIAATLRSLTPGLRAGIRNRAARWARRRQGIDAPVTELRAGRVYILPTGVGIVFALMAFAMLLGSMNYNNNMGFALTFLLAAIAIVSIYQTHRNLLGLTISCRGAEPVFAGESLIFEFVLENAQDRERPQIRIGWDGQPGAWFDLPAASRERVSRPLETYQRGAVAMPRLHVSTQFPIGLFRAWSWINMDAEALVYPYPAPPPAPMPPGGPGGENRGTDVDTDGDFSGLREYRAGDSPRRIAWKALARTGEKVVVEYHSGVSDNLVVDWRALPPGLGTERRIALLARQLLDADAAGYNYALRLPGQQTATAGGERHRHECLRRLALYPAGTGKPS